MDESARVEVEEIKSNSRLSARATSLLQVARTFEGMKLLSDPSGHGIPVVPR
jgi:hypothetical protein